MFYITNVNCTKGLFGNIGQIERNGHSFKSGLFNCFAKEQVHF